VEGIEGVAGDPGALLEGLRGHDRASRRAERRPRPRRTGRGRTPGRSRSSATSGAWSTHGAPTAHIPQGGEASSTLAGGAACGRWTATIRDLRREVSVLARASSALAAPPESVRPPEEYVPGTRLATKNIPPVVFF